MASDDHRTVRHRLVRGRAYPEKEPMMMMVVVVMIEPMMMMVVVMVELGELQPRGWTRSDRRILCPEQR